MTRSLETSVRVPENVVFRELDGEAVLLNLDTGTYFGLDSTGSRIWQLIVEHASLRLVWQAMQQEFEAPADVLEADLLELVDELTAKGLLAPQ